MNWRASMDAIPIFYPTQNYVSQYPSRSGQPYPSPGTSQYLERTLPYYIGPEPPRPQNPKTDNYYFKYHINMNTNYDGFVPK